MKRDRETIQNDKREKFVRLAEARTQKTIEMIRLLGNLSNTSNYSYTEEQVDKIFNALQIELRDARERFNKNANTNKKFRL